MSTFIDNINVLVNKGSSETMNWINNGLMPLGLSVDVWASIFFAKEFVDSHIGYEVTMVGHSKGGGEAIANALATNTNCITFNPRNENYSAYGLNSNNYTGIMTHYIVDGEILSSLIGKPQIGNVVTVPTQYYTMVPTLIFRRSGIGSRIVGVEYKKTITFDDSVDNHQIAAFLKAWAPKPM